MHSAYIPNEQEEEEAWRGIGLETDPHLGNTTVCDYWLIFYKCIIWSNMRNSTVV